MNPEIKDRWVAELRSGAWRQLRGHLSTGDTYCCLGVLCHLAVEAGVVDNCWDGKDRIGYLNRSNQIPNYNTLHREVMRWAGLEKDDPHVAGHALSYYNDDAGMTFAEIAELIEQYL